MQVTNKQEVEAYCTKFFEWNPYSISFRVIEDFDHLTVYRTIRVFLDVQAYGKLYSMGFVVELLETLEWKLKDAIRSFDQKIRENL